MHLAKIMYGNVSDPLEALSPIKLDKFPNSASAISCHSKLVGKGNSVSWTLFLPLLTLPSYPLSL